MKLLWCRFGFLALTRKVKVFKERSDGQIKGRRISYENLKHNITSMFFSAKSDDETDLF